MARFEDWAQHGICGRGVLLDMVRFYEARDAAGKLPYNACNTSAAISAEDLRACAQAQGVEFRLGDILQHSPSGATPGLDFISCRARMLSTTVLMVSKRVVYIVHTRTHQAIVATIRAYDPP